MGAVGETARDFLAWWGEQLRDLLPQRIAGRGADTGDGLWLDYLPESRDGPAQIALTLRKGIQATPLGVFALDDAGLAQARQAVGRAGRPGTIVLQLGPGHALEKSVIMPLAVERELDRVLALEMDRETPFTADEVFWQAHVIRRDREQSRLDIALSLVPKAAVGDLVERLREASLAPALLAAERADGSPMRPIRLGVTRNGAGERDRMTIALGALGLVLLLVACGLPFWRQGRALDRVEARIAALRPAVAEAESLRQKIAGSSQELLAAERARVPEPLDLLATTTKALPDDTYLTDLSLNARKLSLIGQSASAAKLLSALAANAAYGNPVFAAPVTKLEGTPREAFSIDAQIR